MTGCNTIIFGPSGNVGSAAALSAQERGGKVFLAMRNPQKPIAGLSPEQEREGGFERVQADLANPETVHAAVTKTGAKTAFIYIVFGSPDHMRSSIAALKSAGVEFVVFLSSSAVRGDIRSISPSDFVAWAHGQVEINLEEIFGADGFVALRPGWFNSNAKLWKTMIQEGEVRLPYPDAKMDWIAPEDIGAVSGALLTRGGQVDGQNVVILTGPEPVSLGDAARIIGRAIGKDVKVTALDEQEGSELFVKSFGMPAPVVERLIPLLRLRAEGKATSGMLEGPAYEEAVGNIRKYTGKEPTTVEKWAEKHKHEFSA